MYLLAYDPKVMAYDLPRLDAAMRQRVRVAIEAKLAVAPERFGAPLRRGLKGFRKLRVGDWRVVYRIERSTVHILVIGHRRDVYSSAQDRAS